MGTTLESVLFHSPDPAIAANFWSAVLERPRVTEGDEFLLPGSAQQVALRFAAGSAHPQVKNGMHLHLSQTTRSQWDTIRVCLDAGARLLGSGSVSDGSFAVMEDPAGDEFCVIEDDNAYLSGAGPLGEVTCEGTRAVGKFWRRALDWPLVWDEGDETAIQSPAGGTKLAWSGDSLDPARGDGRQRFVLTVATADLDTELPRLVSLGATDVVRATADRVVLRDPDGGPFEIRLT